MNLIRTFLLVAILVVPSLAFADAARVRFSYSKTQIAGKSEWVLMPVPSAPLNGPVTKTTVQGAFNLLKKDKRSTYGSSSILVSGSVPTKAKVKVTIAKNKAKFAPIIMAETVYTLTELGIKGVEFPGFSSGALSRADVPFAGYTLTVPLWKAVNAVSSTSVLVRMPDDSLQSSVDIQKKWKAKDQATIDAVYSYLKAKDDFTVRTVAKLLPGLKVPYVDQVIPLLAHKSSKVRSAALTILKPKNNDTKVLDAVAKVMNSDKNATVALAAADFLGTSKNKKYSVQKTYYMLKKGSAKQQADAIKALATSNTPETVRMLESRLDDKSKQIASAAASSLAKLNANDAQKRALKRNKINAKIRLSIAKDLEKDSNTANQLVGLTYVANNDVDDYALDAIANIGSSKASGARQALEALLLAKQPTRRLAAAEQIAKRKWVESLPALAKAIKAGKNSKEMEEAGYTVMVAQSTKTISDQTKTKNNIVQRLAYRALGEKAAKEKSTKYFNVIKTGLNNKDPLIRGACAQAIGRYGNKAAATALKKLVADKNDTVRADVAFAIGYLPEGTMTDDLKKMLGDKSPAVQAGAISSLGRRGEAFAWDGIKKLASAKDGRVRAAAAEALSKLVSRDDKQGVREVISLLSGRVTDNDARVQVAALQQLGTFKDEKAVTAIALQLNADDETLRLTAIEALGNTKHGAAVDLLTSVLDDRSRLVRRASINAIGTLGDKTAKSALQQRAKKEKDKDIAALIKKTLKKL